MLINVVPTSTSNHSAVVFSVLFENLGDEIAIPAGWSYLRQQLRRDDLPIPEVLHTLDKAAGINSLLEEVHFDLSTNLISCHFVDGWTEQWTIEAPDCVRALQKVILDVNESSMEIELEQIRAKEQEKEREKRFSELTFRSRPKHKKKRSLFMALVDSVIQLSSSTSAPLPSPPPTPIVDNKPRSTISPRARRRLARSELVDTFRRYALAELSRRFPKGGYYSWVILSMLRRNNEAVKFLIDNSQNWVDPHPETHYFPEDSEYFSITAASLPPTPDVSDDESEYSYTETETDSSSLHTPSWPPPANNRTVQHSSREYIPKRQDSGLSTTPRRFASANAQIEYSHLMQEIERLTRLLKYNDDRQSQEEADQQHHLALLEARGKRRAWLNKDLKGGARSQIAAIEMAIPFQPSPLAMSCWTIEDTDSCEEDDGSALFLGQNDYNCTELKIKRTKPRRAAGTRLFPVTEESDEPRGTGNLPAEPQNLQLTIDDFEIDLEDGLYNPDAKEKDEKEGDSDDRSALEVERPQHRPRMRTSSMYKQRIVTPLEPPLPSVPRTRASRSPVSPGGLSCASTFFGDDNSSVSSEDTLLESPVELDNPPAYTEVDVSFNLNVRQLDANTLKEYTKFESSEFTLAMDLPLSVRMQDARREGLSVCWENEE